jgi:hypothetical protein
MPPARTPGAEQPAHVIKAHAVVGRVDCYGLLQPFERPIGIALGEQRLRLLDLFVGSRRLGAGYMLVEKRAHL